MGSYGAKIAFADDDNCARQIFSTTLRNAGFDVEDVKK
jgi:hypothetical protein